ncbi:hypothetical protein [Caulobacter sp. 17J65-9]|uniref:hypothetical protein n=1 Tax=Caulobacter sp. 17J65-9 TaxID=2709382 RepID=UPI0013C5E954|nr:hypothetical protein [Caulobacter sp. 17J65-9]NEX94956.1 hypothetical protein [Caulobacter sp. 17J65-9]
MLAAAVFALILTGAVQDADPAQAARDALDAEVEALVESDAFAATIRERPWARDPNWITRGPGAVGRMHDLCTGAVEPKPDLGIGPWEYETFDPRRLSASQREQVKLWRARSGGAVYYCFAALELHAGAPEARARLGCPSQGGMTFSAFTAYVERRPELRASDDLSGVALAALREAGACKG